MNCGNNNKKNTKRHRKIREDEPSGEAINDDDQKEKKPNEKEIKSGGREK